MSVNIAFSVGGNAISEAVPLDFGPVQAGTSSGIKTVTVSNSGDSDALNCTITPIAATIANGFASDAQVGTAQETYQAQRFAATNTDGTWYSYAVVGVGKNFINQTGGTLAATSGTDSFATRWDPPSSGNSGTKYWGNRLSCVYV